MHWFELAQRSLCAHLLALFLLCLVAHYTFLMIVRYVAALAVVNAAAVSVSAAGDVGGDAGGVLLQRQWWQCGCCCGGLYCRPGCECHVLLIAGLGEVKSLFLQSWKSKEP